MSEWITRIKSGLLKWRVMRAMRLLTHYNEYVANNDFASYFMSENRKSRLRILCDQIRFVISRGNIEEYYYNYGHDRVDSDMGQYLLESEHTKIIADANAHPFGQNVSWEKQFDYKSLVRDKYLFALMAEAFGLPIPKTRGWILGDAVYLQEERRIVAFAEIADYDMDVMLKPTTGNGGVGMVHIKVSDGSITAGGSKMSASEFKSRLKADERYLMQDFIHEQHRDMAALFAGAINTIRVTMVRDEQDEVHLMGVMALMGVGNMIVSNWHYGGIIINVKPDGYLAEYGYSNSLKRVDRHPETGILFKNFRVPYFDEAIALARQASMMLYGLKTIGWDMAITPEGPIFIEGNDMWGMPAHQMVEERGWKDKYVKYFGYRE